MEDNKGIRFYYNGIRVNGDKKLIKCWYSLDDNAVNIYARDYSHLPREYFAVRNNSDPYTDYFDSDSATLTPEHPLYRFARYVALKGLINGKTYRKPTDEQKAEWERMNDPGQPTAADIQAVENMKIAAESARLAREQAEMLERREANLRKISEGRHFIESVAAAHPVVEGQPTVKIGWSESPYLYSLDHGLDNVFSVAAAEIILKHYDDNYDDVGYDKTDFTVFYTDEDSGELRSYEGRYDLGDHDGGLIEHIRAFSKSTMHDEQLKSEICAFADYLEQFTEGGRIVSVELSPEAIAYTKMKQEQNAEREEQARKDFAETLEMVDMLTDEQLKAAVLLLDPTKSDEFDIGKFFLQRLATRDKSAAVELFKQWREGKTGAGD